MTPELQARLQAKLLALRQFVAACPAGLHGARLMHYGVSDYLGSTDFPMEGVESQVSGSVCAGHAVDWVYRNQLLYLRVVDFGAQTPSWERVFAEDDLADVRAILRDDGPVGPSCA